jgi:transposase
MESTGCYWKPIFNVLEDSFEVYLANAQDVKGRKGHKTDRKDCWWLAHLLRHAMIRSSLEHLRFLEEQIGELDEEIQRRIQAAGIGSQLELLHSVPGVGPESATAMLAELGPHMQPFPTPQQLSSWAGVCPGNERSAGKDFRGHTTRGNKYLRAALTECAWAVSHSKNSPLRDKFWRLAVGGKKRAVVAVAHALLLIVYQVLATGQPYQIRAAPLPNERAQRRMIRHHVRCLGRLGVSVGSRRVSLDRLVARRGRPPKPRGATP